MAICIVETMLLLPDEIDKNLKIENVESVDWYMKDFINALNENEQLFSLLSVNTNEEQSFINNFNSFLSVIVGIHRVVATHPHEQKLQIDFARKMASLEIKLELDNE